MAQSNGHDRSGMKSKYDHGSNRYESPGEAGEEHRSTLSVPALVPEPASNSWRARNTPSLTGYDPLLGELRRRRRHAVQLINDLGTATTVAEAGVRFQQALGRLEDVRQSLELMHERRALVPLKAEQERLALGRELIKAKIEFEVALDAQQDERIDRHRRRKLDHDDFEIASINRQAARIEAEARIKAAEVQLAYAPEIGKRRGEAELHKSDEEALRNEAAAEVERRHRDEERQKRTGTEPPQTHEEMPAALAVHYATEKKVRESRTRAQELAEEIRQRAAAEGREPTDDEVEEIDALNDAAAGAEDTIRRGTAGDFEV